MSERRLPPFLATLGLDETAADGASLDERALRRAYARRLKQIDIEADPAGFQALREALEEAQRWVAWQARTRTQAPAAAPVAALEPAPQQGSESVSTSGPLPEPLPEPLPAAPSRELVESTADAVFAELATRLAANVDGEAAVATLLGQALHDERLAAIDTRLHFEWRIARLLAEGWQPGLEFVLDPASTAFAWESDHARLGTFGPVGARIAAAIRERTAFRQMPSSQRAPLLELLQELRSDAGTTDRHLLDTMPRLDALVRRFPNWLGIMAPAARVNARIDAWNRLQKAQAATAPSFPPSRAPARNGPGVGAIVWIALLVIGGLGRLISGTTATVPPATAPTQLDPAAQQRLDADLEQRQRQAEALLQRIVDSGAASQPAAGSGR